MEIKIIIRSTAYIDNPLRFSKRREKLSCANQNVTGARTKIQLSIHIYMFKGLDNYEGLVKRLNKERQKYSPGCAGLAQIFEPHNELFLKQHRAIFLIISVNPEERAARKAIPGCSGVYRKAEQPRIAHRRRGCGTARNQPSSP